MANLLQQFIFDRAFFVVITDPDIERSLKSPLTLFDKYLDQILVKFEQNFMVGNVQNFELLTKNGKPFLRKC